MFYQSDLVMYGRINHRIHQSYTIIKPITFKVLLKLKFVTYTCNKVVIFLSHFQYILICMHVRKHLQAGSEANVDIRNVNICTSRCMYQCCTNTDMILILVSIFAISVSAYTCKDTDMQQEKVHTCSVVRMIKISIMFEVLN